jgi:hypothetical protein
MPFFGKLRNFTKWYKELSIEKAKEQNERERSLRTVI